MSRSAGLQGKRGNERQKEQDRDVVMEVMKVEEEEGGGLLTGCGCHGYGWREWP